MDSCNEETIKKHVIPNTYDFVIQRYLNTYKNIDSFNNVSLLSNCVILDTETTGISVNKEELTQIAAAKIERGKIKDRFNTYVNPGRKIPEEIQNLTGITDEIVKKAPNPDKALKKFVDFVGDSILVAHNVDFDKSFLTKYEAGKRLERKQWIDSLELSKILFPRLKSHRLKDIIQVFSGPKPTHQADKDVEATVFLYRMIVSCAMRTDLKLINSIQQLTTCEEWESSYFFKEILKERATKEGVDLDNVSRETFYLKSEREIKAHHYIKRKETKEKGKGEGKEEGNTTSKEKEKTLKMPTEEEVVTFFEESGCLSEVIDNFEKRQEQIDLALAILENFKKEGKLVVEAGTGIGKTLAYLVVSSLISEKNGIPIGVATKTNNLLDQIVYKDLPLLKRSKKFKELTFYPLKGMSHYLCLRKLDSLVESTNKIRNFNNKPTSIAPGIAMLLSFVEQSVYDDIDMINPGKGIYRSDFTCNPNECYRKRCKYFQKCCFAHGQRDVSQDANIIVTNYSLLFNDALSGGRILPDVKHWILDEAHCIEKEAREAFQVSIDETLLRSLAERSASTKDRSSVFKKCELSFKKARYKEGEKLFYILIEKCKAVGEAFAEVIVDLAIALRSFKSFDKHPRSPYEAEEIWVSEDVKSEKSWEGCMLLMAKASDKAHSLLNACQDIVAFLDDYNKMKGNVAEICNLVFDLKKFEDAALSLNNTGKDYFDSITITRRNSSLPFSVNANPFELGKFLERYLYKRCDSIVFTSATLKVDREFDTFKGTIGIDQEVTEATIDSHFNYDAQMTIYVPTDIPCPNASSKEGNEAYISSLSKLCAEVIRAQGGSTLVLFTSRAEMEKVFKSVKTTLERSDLPVIMQTKGVSTKWLGDQFIEEEKLSLFALKSFWEGFDAPGRTLKCIIIAKLPFSKPTDPLTKEREFREKGNSIFTKYTLPETIIEMRQAVGRLIRKQTDKGVVVLADGRINLNSYGRQILNSMPTDDIRRLSCQDIIKSIESN